MSERCVVEGCNWKLPNGDSCPDHPHAVQSLAALESPYDPDPRPLDKATNGFIRCPTCEQVVELPHECNRLARDYWRDEGNPLPSDFEARAEFAESLLCAMAFDHERSWQVTRESCRLWEPCVFCEAAR